MRRARMNLLPSALVLAVIVVATSPRSTWAQEFEVDGTGNVEATSFKGDGSQLTGINADRLDGMDSSAFATTSSLAPTLSSVDCLARGETAVTPADLEPNGTAATASPLCRGRAPGSLGQGGDLVDFWSQPAAANDRVYAFVFTLEPSPLGGAVSRDATLGVLANNGVTVIESGDRELKAASIEMPVVAGALVPQAGRVFYEVRDDGNDEPLFYSVYGVVADSADTAAESEGNNNAANADPIIRTVMTGNDAPFGDTDNFSFWGKTGDVVWFVIDKDPGNNGVVTDVHCQVFRPDNTLLAATACDDDESQDASLGLAILDTRGFHTLRILHGNGVGATDTDYAFVVIRDTAD